MKNILKVSYLFVVTSALAQTFNVYDTSGLRLALKNAAFNGENDTIILQKGTYSIPDNEGGTFVFQGREAYSLTIEGESGATKNEIILDGSENYQVLKLENTHAADFMINNLTIQNGYASDMDGGGIFSNQNISLDNVIFQNNYSGKNAGAISGTKRVDINQASIFGNSAKGYAGAVMAAAVNIKNSSITSNEATYYGGIFAQSAALTSSILSNNSALYNYGGMYARVLTVEDSVIASNHAMKNYGALAGADVLIANTQITANSAEGAYGGILGTGELTIINSIITGHAKEGAVAGNDVYLFNSVLADNTAALNAKGVFINNIFTNNSDTDITFSGDSVLYHNYIDYTKTEHLDYYNVEQKNNISMTSGTLQFKEDSYELFFNSLGVDAGLNYDDERFQSVLDEELYEKIKPYFQQDIMGNNRVANAIIDLGAYEVGAAPFIQQTDYSQQFIENFYENIFGKTPTEVEIDLFLEQINEDDSATEIAKVILTSAQFEALILTDEAFIQMLYRAFFSREADEEGLAYWLDQMHINNMMREEVIRKFAFSDEFQQICESYFLEPFNETDLLSAFIERFYNILFQRNSDPGGLDYWMEQLSQNVKTPTEVVKFFYLSEEFVGLHYDNETFIDIAYRGLLNRSADEEGKWYWIEQLNNGMSREALIDLFLGTSEFAALQIGL